MPHKRLGQGYAYGCPRCWMVTCIKCTSLLVIPYLLACLRWHQGEGYPPASSYSSFSAGVASSSLLSYRRFDSHQWMQLVALLLQVSRASSPAPALQLTTTTKRL